ncbi:MAG: calcium-translocating P-type ATPase, PMCA-type [Clostridiales bacterium]|nr:calcium-translocating P-type ATPase, PMCA-type [Clostridiales bacterium]
MDWFKQSVDAAASSLGTDLKNGLSSETAQQRLDEHGKNELKQGKKRNVFQMYLEQFKDVMVIVLIVAALISGVLLKEWVDAAIILFVVLLNALLGVIQENRAEKSLEALKKMSSPHAKVRRNGSIVVIPAADMVVGDVVLLEAGDYVSADMRLSIAANLKVNESALTGESEAVEKQMDVIDAPDGVDIPLGDRHNLVFSGSLITYGRGEGIVTETGMNTQIGAIAGMLNAEEGVQTPLQRRMADLGKKLAIVCIAVCALVFLVGVLYGINPVDMLMTAISLAVAAIPEGLLAIVTIVLAIGVQQMIDQNAIVRRLPAVETLGSATVICSDKTGTLTMNRMTVVATSQPFVVDSDISKQLSVNFARALMLCNDGQPTINEQGESTFTGDPTETALLSFATEMGYDKTKLEEQLPREDELPFDSDVKRMTTIHKENGNHITYTKGGLDEVLVLCTRIMEDGNMRPITDDDRERIQNASTDMASSALRVLSFAMGTVDKLAPSGERSSYESDLIFIGMVGMIDPPRPTARTAVEQCKRAGIKPVMITGDHKITASAIATELGILGKGDRVITGLELERMDDDRLREEVRNIAVYARVSPEHKVRIVKAWQSYGDVVAMTGDGVNDAPALKRADIGVAMGISGTEVSKEASAMILTDDNFATIVSAVSQGRTIYSNILKAIQFLLSSNLGEILVIFIATLFNWGTPLLPIHILWVNLITDTLPALALGMEPAEPDVMDAPPRDPKSPIFTKPLIFRVCYQGIMISLLTLFAFMFGRKVSPDVGHTMAFAVLSLSQLVHSFNLRSNTHSAFSRHKMNKWMFPAFFSGIALQVCVFFIPFLSSLFRVATLTAPQWLLVLGLSVAPLLIVELFKKLGWTGESRYKQD